MTASDKRYICRKAGAAQITGPPKAGSWSNWYQKQTAKLMVASGVASLQRSEQQISRQQQQVPRPKQQPCTRTIAPAHAFTQPVPIHTTTILRTPDDGASQPTPVGREQPTRHLLLETSACQASGYYQ